MSSFLKPITLIAHHNIISFLACYAMRTKVTLKTGKAGFPHHFLLKPDSWEDLQNILFSLWTKDKLQFKITDNSIERIY